MAVAEPEAESPPRKVFSETVGARHLLVCNVIKDAIDPISGKGLIYFFSTIIQTSPFSGCQKIIAQFFDKVNTKEPLGEKSFIWPEDGIPEVCLIEVEFNIYRSFSF